MDVTKRYDIVRLRQGYAVEKMQDSVITEYPFRIELNGKLYSTITCTPQHLQDLVMGRMLSDGVVRARGDITALSVDAQNGVASVTLAGEAGKGDTQPLPLTQTFHVDSVVRAVQLFLQNSELYQATGAVHSSALWEPDSTQVMFFREDIGRKNAIDKVLGAAMEANVSLSETFLLTSGRVPADLLQKVLHARIPVLISRTALTTAAIDLAREKNITLVGFARGTRISIYAGEARIEGL